MSARADTADVFSRVADTDPTETSEAAADLDPSPAADRDNPPIETPVAQPRRPRRRFLAITVCTAVMLTLLSATGFFGWRTYQAHTITTASAEALQAARDYAVVLTTLDAKNIDNNYRRTLDGATGEFKDAYSQGAAQLRQILIDNKAAGTGIVIDAAVKAATRDTVEVLLFVDQSITNAANTNMALDIILGR